MRNGNDERGRAVFGSSRSGILRVPLRGAFRPSAAIC